MGKERDLVHWRYSTPGRFGCPLVAAKSGVKRSSIARALTCERCKEHIERILKRGGTQEQIEALDREAHRFVEWEQAGREWLALLRRARQQREERSQWDRRPPLSVERLEAIREFCARRLARMLARRPVQCGNQKSCDHPQCVIERVWQRGQFLAESALINTSAYRDANAFMRAWDLVPDDPIPRRRHHSTYQVPFAADGITAVSLPRAAFEKPLAGGARFCLLARVS